MTTFKKRFLLKTNLRSIAMFNLALIFGIILFLTIVWVILLWWVQQPRSGTNSSDSFPSYPLLLTIITTFVFLALLPNLISAISKLVSRLDVSDQGLDYMFWPFYHIRCAWSDVQSITRRKEIIETDILLLNRANEIGLPISIAIRKRLGMDTQYFIPLNSLDGWPTGELANVIHQYAPHLF